jgi:hypothetical protein
MGMFDGIINAGFHSVFNDAIDALLETTALTLPCQLIFDDTNTTVCPNCEYDSVGKTSAGIYKTGGPIAFTNGNCPYCHGIGLITVDENSIIYPLVVWNYKDWVGFAGQASNKILVPFGVAQTLTKQATITDIRRAKQIWLSTHLDNYTKHIFERTIEPFTIGLGQQGYCVCNWERVGS